ncbi:hypothetical protein [Mycobacterium sp. C31M]
MSAFLASTFPRASARPVVSSVAVLPARWWVALRRPQLSMPARRPRHRVPQ